MSNEKQPDETQAGTEDVAAEYEGGEQSNHESGAPIDETEELREQAGQLLDRLQRTAADLENLKKRHRKQLDDERKFGQSRLLKDFVEVFDDLHLAISHSAGDEPSENAAETETEVEKGIRLVHDKFKAVLDRHGVRSVGEVGEQFDPNVHEALHRQEDPSVPRNTVIQVFQRGYVLNDRVIKPAGVVVSAGGPDPEDV